MPKKQYGTAFVVLRALQNDENSYLIEGEGVLRSVKIMYGASHLGMQGGKAN